MFSEEFIFRLVIRVPVVLLALTVHEYMHAYAAYRCGDDTARLLGRLTLNPLKHLDFIGTLMLMFGPIGWAKPVPINPYNFRHPRRDDIIVSVAGVAANFAMAIGFCILLRLLLNFGLVPASRTGDILVIVILYAIVLNFGLGIFNLLPIAPLDGHHVIRELLPYEASQRFMEFSRYGPMLLIALVVLGGRLFSFLYLPIGPLVSLFGGPQVRAMMAYVFGL